MTLPDRHPFGWRARGPFVRYSISKAMSKVVVFQGRAVPSHLCYTFRITSRLCLESSSTIRMLLFKKVTFYRPPPAHFLTRFCCKERPGRSPLPPDSSNQ